MLIGLAAHSDDCWDAKHNELFRVLNKMAFCLLPWHVIIFRWCSLIDGNGLLNLIVLKFQSSSSRLPVAVDHGKMGFIRPLEIQVDLLKVQGRIKYVLARLFENLVMS